MLFWHVGATIAFIRYAFRDEAMDLRFLALGALLPDLLDTPVGAIGWSIFATVRLWGHSFLFGTTVMVLVLLITRRGPARKRWMLLATGSLLHLGLDAMWNQPETLWWPFLGTVFSSTGFATFGAYAVNILADPLVWVGEAVGAAYLILLWRRSDLGDAAARQRLLKTGVVSAGIDRS
ncbi:MAG: metal-dependent hydrolase [Actinomycetia bacterium]|nr:metal-dependent hydrolase [Actinomycetes bacterium]